MAGPPFEGSFEFIGHTADIAVRVRGRTEEELFRAAAQAFTEALTARSAVRAAANRQVTLTAPELDMLLVDWLEELLFLFETEAFLVRDADVIVQTPSGTINATISATVRGESRDASRHPLKVLIKGVTYHGLHIEKGDEGYAATVIFDI